MAYTYNDFVTAANNAGLMDQFDTNDLDYAKKYPEYGLSMVSLKRDLGNAKTDEQRLLATEAMNQLRKNYGSYWTGDQGNRSYAASYGSKINNTLDKINNYGDFNWDPEKDELFSQYKKTYLREGDRAAANALAQAAAASGGNVSTYAEQAAQQAGNYWAGKVADAIPELRNQRYSEYQGGFDMLQKALSDYQNQDKSDYQRYLDMVNAEYQRERDAVADAEKELQNAIAIYQLTGTPTGVLKDLLAAAGVGTGGGGGGGGGSGGGGSYYGGSGSSGTKSGSTSGSTKVNTSTFKDAGSGDDVIKNSNAGVYRGVVGSTTATAAGKNMGGTTPTSTTKSTSSSSGKTVSYVNTGGRH